MTNGGEQGKMITEKRRAPSHIMEIDRCLLLHASGTAEWRCIMADEYGADLVTVLDDEGNEHQFELVDAIETDDGRYVALLPVYDNPAEGVNDDGELIILEVKEENGEELLVPIEDESTFEDIAEIFEERLSDLYEIEELDGPVQ